MLKALVAKTFGKTPRLWAETLGEFRYREFRYREFLPRVSTASFATGSFATDTFYAWM